ncbi:leucine-rich repeat serine/threonine-protein kinase 2-like [Sycon ciliatum]|uniref:leucine-rich repeat serine/threonine-protein kinase 2-like n=1 Tax=Sycon ciliatum TaxID=27933 RepID=UPI0031F64AA6
MTSSARFFLWCSKGRVQRIKEALNKGGNIDRLLEERHGMFLYTPLHVAVVKDQHEVVEVLVKFYYADVNCKSGNGYTPLHLAAHQGYRECAKHLLSASVSVDFELRDSNNRRTALEAAQDAGNTDIVKMIRSAALFQAVNTRYEDCAHITRLLERVQWQDFEPGVFEKCLTVCAAKGFLLAASLLLIRPHSRFDVKHFQKLSLENNHFLLGAFFMLFKAAKTNEPQLFKQVESSTLDEKSKSDEPAKPDELAKPADTDAVAASKGSRPSTIQSGSGDTSRSSSQKSDEQARRSSMVQHAIEECLSDVNSRMCLMAVAKRKGHVQVVKELLLRHKANKKAHTVGWEGLVLRDVNSTWIAAVADWVTLFNLNFNYLSTVPKHLAQCSHLTKLFLRGNKLRTVPDELVQMLELRTLDLSANDLTSLPECNWTENLVYLNVTQNVLDSLPLGMMHCKESLDTLYINSNQFTKVPELIGELQSLQFLDLSHNHASLNTLPDFLGNLTYLHSLGRAGLNITQPPRAMTMSDSRLKTLLRQRQQGCKPYYGMKLMVVGLPGKGKTTLIGRLRGIPVMSDMSTVGIDINEWNYRPPEIADAAATVTRLKEDIQYRVWDFAGQQVYYTTHQCFLSSRCVYVLVWNVNDGQRGIDEMSPWLDNIRMCARHSVVVIVTTHIDVMLEQQQDARVVVETEGMLQKFASRTPYREMTIKIAPLVSDVQQIRLTIVEATVAIQLKRSHKKALGEEIPKCYIDLEQVIVQKRMELRATNAPQILNIDELQELIRGKGVIGLDHDSELAMAVKFLHENGTLLHYDNAADLETIYFIDPQWLSDMISAIVTIRERNPHPYGGQGRQQGVMLRENIWSILSEKSFPHRYEMEYLSLLHFFAVVVFMDIESLLIPSLLSDNPPPPSPLHTSHTTTAGSGRNEAKGSLQRRYCMGSIPHGLFSRMSARLLCQLGPELKARGMLLDDWLSPVGGRSHSSGNGQQHLPSPHHVHAGDCGESCGSAGSTDGRIVVWKSGLKFEHGTDLGILIREFEHPSSGGAGIDISIRGAQHSRYFMAIVINQIDTLLREWYSDIMDDPLNPLRVECGCPVCKASNRISNTFLRLSECKHKLDEGKSTLWCWGHRGDVSMADVVPELLMENLPAEVLLSSSRVQCDFNDKDNQLGVGGYGQVYRGYADGQRVAVKVYRDRDGTLSGYRELSHEVTMLHQLQHPHIVRVVGVVLHPLQFVLELAPLGSLRSLTKEKKMLPRLLLYSMAAQIAEVLQFLDERSVVYRDLKSDNILVFSKDVRDKVNLKLTDFGQASACAPYGIKGIGGTCSFQAPELLRRVTYTRKVDMYSFGCVLWELLTNSRPYAGKLKHAIFRRVIRGAKPKLEENDCGRVDMPCLVTLMDRAWHKSAKLRPQASDTADFLRMRHVQLLKREQVIMAAAANPDAISAKHIAHVQSLNTVLIISSSVQPRKGCLVEVLEKDSLKLLGTTGLLLPGNEVTNVLLVNEALWMGTTSSSTASVISVGRVSATSSRPVSPDGSLSACPDHRPADVSCMEHWQGTVLIAATCGCISSFTHDQEHRWTYRLDQGFASAMLRAGAQLWVACGQRILVLSDETERHLTVATTFLSATESLGCSDSTNSHLKSLQSGLACSWTSGCTELLLWKTSSLTATVTPTTTAQTLDSAVASGNHGVDVPSRRKLLHIQINSRTAPKSAALFGCSEENTSISDVVLANKCLWVAMSTGHVLIYNLQGDVLTWIRPFKGKILSLARLHSDMDTIRQESVLGLGLDPSTPQSIIGVNTTCAATTATTTASSSTKTEGRPIAAVDDEAKEERAAAASPSQLSIPTASSGRRSPYSSSTHSPTGSSSNTMELRSITRRLATKTPAPTGTAVVPQSAMLWDAVDEELLRLLHTRSRHPEDEKEPTAPEH